MENAADQDEFLRLPRGFNVHSGRSFDHYVTVLAGISRAARLAGLEPLLMPAVSFASTFNRVAGTTGEKTFEFADRKGRQLMLAPDSSPAVLRWHLERPTPEKSSRTAWVAPVFRYRKQQNRSFHQFGVSFVNDVVPPHYDNDYQLAEALNVLLEILRTRFELEPTIRVTHVAAIRRLLVEALGESDRAEEMLTQLHFSRDSAEAVRLVTDRCPTCVARDVLVLLLSPDIARSDMSSAAKEVREDYESIVNEMGAFGKLVRSSGGVELCPWDLHSSQTLSGLGVQLLAPGGRRLGDGGRYDLYARRFHNELFSFVSVCAGVEGVYRQIKEKSPSQCDISILTFPDCLAVALPLVESLRSAGITARLEVVKGRVGPAREAARRTSIFVTVIGKSEIAAQTLSVTSGVSAEAAHVPMRDLLVWLTQSGMSSSAAGR